MKRYFALAVLIIVGIFVLAEIVTINSKITTTTINFSYDMENENKEASFQTQNYPNGKTTVS